MNVNGQWIVTTPSHALLLLPGQLACLRADLAGMAAAM
jgi:hypothetical protein